MSDPIHLEEVQKTLTAPLHQKLVASFIDMVRDSEKGSADYSTHLKVVLEENLAVDADAVPRSNG
jgi:hypothetical protein